MTDVLHTPRPASELAAVLGFDPASIPMLDRALTHRSYAYVTGAVSNELLEFLGNAVLGLAVTRSLCDTFPHEPEGQLAKRRAALVNMRSLATVARQLHLGQYVKLGSAELAPGGTDRPSILADTLEAIVGAVCLGAGPSTATDLACLLVLGGWTDLVLA